MRIVVIVVLACSLAMLGPAYGQTTPEVLVDIDGDGLCTPGESQTLEWWVTTSGMHRDAILLEGVPMDDGGWDLSAFFLGLYESEPPSADAGAELPGSPSSGTGFAAWSPLLSQFTPGTQCMFVRGNVNATIEDDPTVDLADPLYLLAFLFNGGPDPVSQDAADINDDGAVDLSDAIGLLNYLYGASPDAPATPYPDAGYDPTLDQLEYLCDANYDGAVDEAARALMVTLGYDGSTAPAEQVYMADGDLDFGPEIALFLEAVGMLVLYEFEPTDNATGGSFFYRRTWTGVSSVLSTRHGSSSTEAPYLAIAFASGALEVYSPTAALGGSPDFSDVMQAAPQLFETNFGVVALHEFDTLVTCFFPQSGGIPWTQVEHWMTEFPSGLLYDTDANGDMLYWVETAGGGYFALSNAGVSATAGTPSDWLDVHWLPPGPGFISPPPQNLCCCVVIPPTGGSGNPVNEELNFEWLTLTEEETASAAVEFYTIIGQPIGTAALEFKSKAFRYFADLTIQDSSLSCLPKKAGLAQHVYSNSLDWTLTKASGPPAADKCKKNGLSLSGYDQWLWDHDPVQEPVFYVPSVSAGDETPTVPSFTMVPPEEVKQVDYTDRPSSPTLTGFNEGWMLANVNFEMKLNARAMFVCEQPGGPDVWTEMSSRAAMLKIEITGLSSNPRLAGMTFAILHAQMLTLAHQPNFPGVMNAGGIYNVVDTSRVHPPYPRDCFPSEVQTPHGRLDALAGPAVPCSP